MITPITQITQRTKFCPIKEGAEKAIDQGGEMVKALRELRRSLRNCPRCPQSGGCRLWREFNTQVDLAIHAVNEEWGLV